MTSPGRRPLWAWLAAGLVGLWLALGLGPSTFLLTASGMALDRAGAVRTARTYLASLGVDSRGFQAHAAFWADDNLAAYLQARFSPPEARRIVASGELVPAMWIVWLRPPGGGRSTPGRVPPRQVDFDAEPGQTHWWVLLDPAGAPVGLQRTLPGSGFGDRAAEGPVRALLRRFVARYQLLDLAAYPAPRYRTQKTLWTEPAQLLEWVPAPVGDREPVAALRATFSQGERRVIGFRREPRLPASHRPIWIPNSGVPLPRDPFLGGQFLLLWILNPALFFLSILICMRGHGGRRPFRWRAALLPSLLYLALWTFLALAQLTGASEAYAAFGSDGASADGPLPNLILMPFAVLLGTAGLYFAWVAGDGLLRETTGRGVALGTPHAALLRGTALGLALAGGLIGLAWVARWLGVTPSGWSITEGVNARWPALYPLVAALATVLLVEVACRVLVYAWLGAKRRDTRAALLWAGLLWGISGGAPLAVGFRPAVWDLLFIPLGIGLSVVYARFGLLTVITAGTVAGTWWRALPLTFAQSPALASPAIAALTLSLALPLAGAILLARRRQPDEEGVAPFLPRAAPPAGVPADEEPLHPRPAPAEDAPVLAFGRIDQSFIGLIYFVLFVLLARASARAGQPADLQDVTVLGPFVALASLLLPTRRAQQVGLVAAIALCAAAVAARRDEPATVPQLSLSLAGIVLAGSFLAWVSVSGRLRATMARVFFAAVATIALSGLGTAAFLPLAREPSPNARVNFIRRTGEATVTQAALAEGGAAEALRQGDRILAVNGQEVSTRFNAALAAHQQSNAQLGRTTTYRILRARKEQTLTFTARAQPASHWAGAIAQVVAALFCVGLAGLVVWRRPLQGVAWLFAGLNLSLAYMMVGPSLALEAPGWPFSLRFAWVFTMNTVIAFSGPFFLHFFLVFPSPKRLLRRYPALLYLIYLPGVIACLANWSGLAGGAAWGSRVPAGFFLSLWVALGLMAMLHSYLTARDAAAKRQILVIFLVTLAIPPTMLACLLLFISPVLFSGGQNEATLVRMANLALRLPFVLLPAAFAYAIFQYRAMNISVIVRQGLVYGAVLTVAVVGYYLLVVGAGQALLTLTGQTSPMLTMAGTLALAVLLRPVAVATRRAVDRRFYRDRLEVARRLRALTREVLSLLDRDAILARLITDLPTLFPARGATLFLLDPGDDQFHPVPSAQEAGEQGGGGEGETGDGRLEMGRGPHTPSLSLPPLSPSPLLPLSPAPLPRDSQLLRRLEQERQPVPTYDTEPRRRAGALSAADRQLVRELGAVLWVPLLLGERVVGVLALGEKLSEEAYSEEELEALCLIANEAAVALENAALSADRERQARLQQEVAIGRSIQLQLLPPTRLEIPGYEVLSRSEPATEVGGDFYNVFEVAGESGEVGEWGSGEVPDRGREEEWMSRRVDESESSARPLVRSSLPTPPLPHSATPPLRLGVLLGDVAGKGVPAALFMAVTTTLVEGQAQLLASPAATLAATNARLYRKMKQPGAEQLFATAVYGVLDTARNEITLASAGQTPPVYWPAGGELRYLRLKGVPLGALRTARYREQTQPLHPGDRLLFLSDGFVEDRDAAGEPVGYAGFLRQLAALGALAGQELIDALFTAGDENADRDDRTLVLITARSLEERPAAGAAARENPIES